MPARRADLAWQRVLERARASEPGARVGRGELLDLEVPERVLHGRRCPSRDRRENVSPPRCRRRSRAASRRRAIPSGRARAERRAPSAGASAPATSQEANPETKGAPSGGPPNVESLPSATRPVHRGRDRAVGAAHADAAPVDGRERLRSRERALQDLAELDRRADRIAEPGVGLSRCPARRPRSARSIPTSRSSTCSRALATRASRGRRKTAQSATSTPATQMAPKAATTTAVVIPSPFPCANCTRRSGSCIRVRSNMSVPCSARRIGAASATLHVRRWRGQSLPPSVCDDRSSTKALGAACPPSISSSAKAARPPWPRRRPRLSAARRRSVVSARVSTRPPRRSRTRRCARSRACG